MIGWSGLERLGAVLIMPAIVALVASNFAKPDRPRAYGLVAAAGAIAAALGPLVACSRPTPPGDGCSPGRS
jgi:MFS family permease